MATFLPFHFISLPPKPSSLGFYLFESDDEAKQTVMKKTQPPTKLDVSKKARKDSGNSDS